MSEDPISQTEIEEDEEPCFDSELEDEEEESKIPIWNGLIEHVMLTCICCKKQFQLGECHHSYRMPVTQILENKEKIEKPALYILVCPHCEKQNIVAEMRLMSREEAEGETSDNNWMQSLLKLKEFPIKWDRITDKPKEQQIILYGWITRKDEKGRDFVLIEFYRSNPVAFHTSSAKYSKRINDVLGFGKHRNCIPFDQIAYEKLLVGDPK